MLFRRKNPDDDNTTPGRPAGVLGNTGLRFSGWYGAATQTLVHASRDDDPRCQLVLCTEARMACEWAKTFAKNRRQMAMCESLDRAIGEVRSIAEKTPPLPVPHEHGLLDSN